MRSTRLRGAFADLTGAWPTSRYLLGNVLTEADVRLWVTLVRFDVGPNADGRSSTVCTTTRTCGPTPATCTRSRRSALRTDLVSFSQPGAAIPAWNEPNDRASVTRRGTALHDQRRHMTIKLALVPADRGRQPHRGAVRARTATAARRRIDYLAQIARAADQLGLRGRAHADRARGARTPGSSTAALIRETQRLKFLVAFRPGALSPTLAAQKAATYQRISGGRLLLNIVTGGDAGEQRRFGDWLDHDERYDRTDEFLTVLRGALSATSRSTSRVATTTSRGRPSAEPVDAPPLYFGGASAGRRASSPPGTSTST